MNDRDLISQSALKEYLSYLEKTAMCNVISFEELRVVIDAAPAVDAVEVVHGEWVDDRDDPRFICGGCDKWFLVENATGDMNFCPNCGADMRERKGDE